ncbi:MAG: hypothetical protein IPK19_21875 [Chloroflexi bacterium]|nr:hypothetical protein [Chloroflexota bacterium]
MGIEDTPGRATPTTKPPEKEVKRRGTKLDLVLIIAFFLSLIILILVAVLITLNSQNGGRPPATQAVPTLASIPGQVVPEATAEATLEITLEAGG